MSSRKNRSDKYQHIFSEIVPNDESIGFGSVFDFQYSNPEKDSETKKELRDELLKNVYRLIDCHLTNRQKMVINYKLMGYDQWTTAKLLNANQSSITKSMYGNKVYEKRNGRKYVCYYGGAYPKLKKLIENDLMIQTIILAINEEE